MKKIWQYLVNHIKEDFNAPLYLSITTFLSVIIFLNFYFDIEDSFIDVQPSVQKFFYFLLLQSIVYFIPVYLLFIFKKNRTILTFPFFIRSMLALTLLSLDRSLLFIDGWIFNYLNAEVLYWAYKVINNLVGIFFVILPLFIFYYLTDRKQKNFYGLNSRPIDLRPYLLLLLIMVPVVVGVSFLTGFQKQYPMYISTSAHVYLGIPEWITAAIYELAYALNFVSVEFFYRGFLVLGMVAFLGRSAILPMACLYCALHFGKPMPEAISSIFGGYILGVIALETRSIWGGIMVHVGIAWLMEAVAYLQKQAQ